MIYPPMYVNTHSSGCRETICSAVNATTTICKCAPPSKFESIVLTIVLVILMLLVFAMLYQGWRLWRETC